MGGSSASGEPRHAAGVGYRKVTDGKGRGYRFGESGRDLLGHSST
ncbi:hypothetical protein [Streptomyces xanthochromogenes]|nr:hypothetical protein [Streptomyces xanthochromogenes]